MSFQKCVYERLGKLTVPPSAPVLRQLYLCVLLVCALLHRFLVFFLGCQIGKKKIDDSSDENEIKRETLKPQFFRSFDVQVTMPGDSRLKLKASAQGCRAMPDAAA